jgi:hypothetical protein
MKVTNISTGTVFLADLYVIRESQAENRPGEARYLQAGASVYLPDTSEVLRSARVGTLKKFKDAGVLTLEDTVTLAAGVSTTLTHNWTYPPVVYALKQVGVTWVDATGTFDAVQNAAFTTVTFTNTTAFGLAA